MVVVVTCLLITRNEKVMEKDGKMEETEQVTTVPQTNHRSGCAF